MKKLKIALLMIVAAVMVLPSCKKGENDPFISLKSRDARITAKWKLTKIEGTLTNAAGTNSVITTYSYNGTTYIISKSDGTPSNTGTGTYEMTIDKDGILTYTETYTAQGMTSADVKSGTGTWMWYSSNKNKNFIKVDGASNLFTGGTFYVDKLKSKELILKISNTNTTTQGTVTTTDSTDKTYTFEKQ